MFIKKKFYKTACKETWSVATPVIATDYAGHTGFFDRKVSSCFIQGQKPAQTFNPTWYSRGWRGSGLQTFLQSEHRLVAFLQHIKWHICSVGAWKYLTWCEKANEMLTSHAKRIFSDNVTCFGKNKSCSNRSHLPQCFIKAPLLACMVTLFLYGKSKDFFPEGDIRNIPDCPGRNNSHFALENEGCNMSLVFQYGILPGSFPFRAWCGDFQFRGCISTKTLSSKRGLLTGTSWNWRVCPLQAWQ